MESFVSCPRLPLSASFSFLAISLQYFPYSPRSFFTYVMVSVLLCFSLLTGARKDLLLSDGVACVQVSPVRKTEPVSIPYYLDRLCVCLREVLAYLEPKSPLL